MLEIDEAMAKSASRQFEKAQRTIWNSREFTPPEDVLRYMNENRKGILQDVRVGIIDERFAELMWLGLYHYVGSYDIPIEAEMLSNLSAAQ